MGKGNGKAVDWWALGILIYEMLAGSPPFTSEQKGLFENIVMGRVEYPAYVDNVVRRRTAEDVSYRIMNNHEIDEVI